MCLCRGPCWDIQPTPPGHSLAPGRGGPRTGETEGDRKKRKGEEGSGLMHGGSTLRQIGLLRQKGPVGNIPV
ncbi:hypothetical protein KUCAC02_010050 [Chaenocephalus aceratus]|uniref:Uncharacterized protein n=1 Tax=Chaenocephalus aceratus TaxID=36190 RepID=A0ACB9VZS7_CHAAC|nr:hypothetical protein KUCAC02_010050 [Chaenocephalus aceratus]